MSLVAGTKLGPYEVSVPVGAGGMGEVYRARDTKLRRDVALKVLPEAFARDAQRLARFEREAQVLAALNHPQIASIYGFEDSSGVRALVMELVEGPTLADRIAGGAMTLEDALPMTQQIAEALEYAHEHGIIHRDLKPGNIKVTPDGTVKLLDFGLAKALEGDFLETDIAESPTISMAATRDGIILGTAAYMSPEQAKGKPVDKRADIWAFGCVLYEMLTGKTAFSGETTTDILAGVVRAEPPWERLPAQTPRRIRELLRRCLQKDPKHRLRDIGDARIEIEETLRQPQKEATQESLAPAAGRGWPVPPAVLAGVLAGGLLAWSFMRIARSEESSVPHLAGVARLTHDPDYSQWPTWSPDGTMLAFSSNRSGNYEIYVRRLEGGQEVNVTNDPGQDIQPDFSPDGNWIAFVSTRSSRTGMVQIGSTVGSDYRTVGGDIWLVPALGGQARLLARDGNFPVWHRGGNKVLYVSGPENHRALLEVTADGGAPRAVLPAESSNWEIVRSRYSPSGRWITLETYEQQILIIPADGGQPRQLLAGESHVWDPSGGRLYYCTREFSGGTRLLSVEIDESAGKLKGDPKSVGLVTANLKDLAISNDGRRVAAAEVERSLNLTRLPLNASGDAPAGPEEVLSRGKVNDRVPAVSPDNKTVAYISDRLGHDEMWILHLDTNHFERLQLPGHDFGEWAPKWFPDGRKMFALRRYADGKSSLWVVFADGSHAEELVPPGDLLSFEAIPVSPDGRTVTYSMRSDGFFQLFDFDVATRQSKQLTFTPGDKYGASRSPDGGWLVYSSNAGGAVNLWKISASGGPSVQLTKGNDRIRHMFYSREGSWIYFQPNHQNIYRMPAMGGAAQQVTHFLEPTLFIEEPTISPDGRYLYYARSNGGASLWLLTVGTGKLDSPEK